jgi:putative methyltransferase (TIGR04325 family)
MSEAWRSLIPTGFRRWWRSCFGWRWFRGEYATWAEAKRHATADDGGAQLARVCAAARLVRAGLAAWDRDGIAFAEPAVHAPLLAALRHGAGATGGRLDVVDFGGGLGSTWRQHRSALADCSPVRWCVVERPRLVEAGRKEFADGPLQFQASLAEAIRAGPVTTILLSSVLPYLEEPYELLAEIVESGCAEVILDRTPFIAGSNDRIVVQHTPPALGGGSHPCRLFARSRIQAVLEPHYTLVAEWPVPFDQIDDQVDYLGLHFRRRPAS